MHGRGRDKPPSGHMRHGAALLLKKPTNVPKASGAPLTNIASKNINAWGKVDDSVLVEHEEGSGLPPCEICFEYVASTKIVPCDHEICPKCASQIRKRTASLSGKQETECPFCRGKIEGFNNVVVSKMVPEKKPVLLKLSPIQFNQVSNDVVRCLESMGGEVLLSVAEARIATKLHPNRLALLSNSGGLLLLCQRLDGRALTLKTQPGGDALIKVLPRRALPRRGPGAPGMGPGGPRGPAPGLNSAPNAGGPLAPNTTLAPVMPKKAVAPRPMVKPVRLPTKIDNDFSKRPKFKEYRKNIDMMTPGNQRKLLNMLEFEFGSAEFAPNAVHKLVRAELEINNQIGLCGGLTNVLLNFKDLAVRQGKSSLIFKVSRCSPDDPDKKVMDTVHRFMKSKPEGVTVRQVAESLGSQSRFTGSNLLTFLYRIPGIGIANVRDNDKNRESAIIFPDTSKDENPKVPSSIARVKPSFVVQPEKFCADRISSGTNSSSCVTVKSHVLKCFDVTVARMQLYDHLNSKEFGNVANIAPLGNDAYAVQFTNPQAVKNLNEMGLRLFQCFPCTLQSFTPPDDDRKICEVVKDFLGNSTQSLQGVASFIKSGKYVLADPLPMILEKSGGFQFKEIDNTHYVSASEREYVVKITNLPSYERAGISIAEIKAYLLGTLKTFGDSTVQLITQNSGELFAYVDFKNGDDASKFVKSSKDHGILLLNNKLIVECQFSPWKMESAPQAIHQTDRILASSRSLKGIPPSCVLYIQDLPGGSEAQLRLSLIENLLRFGPLQAVQIDKNHKGRAIFTHPNAIRLALIQQSNYKPLSVLGYNVDIEPADPKMAMEPEINMNYFTTFLNNKVMKDKDVILASEVGGMMKVDAVLGNVKAKLKTILSDIMGFKYDTINGKGCVVRTTPLKVVPTAKIANVATTEYQVVHNALSSMLGAGQRIPVTDVFESFNTLASLRKFVSSDKKKKTFMKILSALPTVTVYDHNTDGELICLANHEVQAIAKTCDLAMKSQFIVMPEE